MKLGFISYFIWKHANVFQNVQLRDKLANKIDIPKTKLDHGYIQDHKIVPNDLCGLSNAY